MEWVQLKFENFLELIKVLISKHSDEKYNFILFLNDDQKYSSEAFDFDYDYRLNFDTHDSVTILLRRNTEEGFYDVGKATFYIRTAYEILDSECWKICKRNDTIMLHKTKLSELEEAVSLINKEYYIKAGYAQTSVNKKKLTIANRYKAINFYIDLLKEWKQTGGGLFVEPAGVCCFNNESTYTITEKDVDFKFLGQTSELSLVTEKLCRKMGFVTIKGAYQQYTLGTICVC